MKTDLPYGCRRLKCGCEITRATRGGVFFVWPCRAHRDQSDKHATIDALAEYLEKEEAA